MGKYTHLSPLRLDILHILHDTTNILHECQELLLPILLILTQVCDLYESQSTAVSMVLRK